MDGATGFELLQFTTLLPLFILPNTATAGIDKSESQWDTGVSSTWQQHSNKIQISSGSLVKYDASGLIRTNPPMLYIVAHSVFGNKQGQKEQEVKSWIAKSFRTTSELKR